MRVVMWIDNQANQKALAHKIAAKYGLTGIIIEKREGRRKITIKKIYQKIIDKLFLSSITNAWFGMLRYYDRQYAAYPDTAITVVENINADTTFNLTQNMNPDLIIVSGTRLIKEKLLALHPAIGIINLHTGLSPYIKGGPNCTNWCIATNQLFYIGNTIMWIDKGIDTGNIITTAITRLTGAESLLEVHIKVMEHGHDLYIRAIEKLFGGARPVVKQSSIAQGVTYYTKEWTLKQRFALKNNFKNFRQNITSAAYQEAIEKVTTVKL